jgi:hypothetical protein
VPSREYAHGDTGADSVMNVLAVADLRSRAVTFDIMSSSHRSCVAGLEVADQMV